MAALLVVRAGTAGAEVIEDSANRRVNVPAAIARVVPAGVPAQVLLQVLAPGKLVGVVEAFAPQHVIYVDPTLAALPQIPVLTRTDAPGDIAAVAALKPELVVDYGTVSARYVEADKKIESELGVPTLLFDGSMAAVPAVARTLAGALGVVDGGNRLAGAAMEVLGAVAPVANLPDGKRVPVYLARGADGLTAARAGTVFDEPIRLAGGRNVVAGSGPPFTRMSVAAVVALKPAVVIVSDTGALSSPLHAALPKGTRFFLDAGEPYKVLAGPPSVNRLIGTLALAALLHPDAVKVEPAAIGRLATTLFPAFGGPALPAPLQPRD